VCDSPTRFFVHEKAYDKYVGKFTDLMKATTTTGISGAR
jgi:acyl-CoA reductase-like NAD-dependent aldehyde dehydrogenase